MNKNQDICSAVGHILFGLETIKGCLAQKSATDHDLNTIWTICRKYVPTHPRKLNAVARLEEGVLTPQAEEILEDQKRNLQTVLFRLRQERNLGPDYQKHFNSCVYLAQLKRWWGSLEKREQQVGFDAMRYRLGRDPKEVFRSNDALEQVDVLAVAMYAVEVLTEKARKLDKRWKQLNGYDQKIGLEILADLVKQDPLVWWRKSALSERIRILDLAFQTLEDVRELAQPENPPKTDKKALIAPPGAQTCAA